MATATSYELNLVASRFTDILDEPLTRLLGPITGYQDLPLVTLEESVKPTAHFLDEIEIRVFMTKIGMAKPADGLSEDESRSIHLYTMPFDSGLCLFQVLNKALRDEDRQNLKPWFPFLKLFLTALHKLPSQAMIVWRGLRDVDLRSKYPVGSILAWWGVSSCTTSIEELESRQILGREGLRTIFCIECQNGKSITTHSYFQNIKEVILMPGFYFEVRDHINPVKDLYFIRLREIQPAHSRIEPPLFKASPLAPSKTPSGIVALKVVWGPFSERLFSEEFSANRNQRNKN